MSLTQRLLNSIDKAFVALDDLAGTFTLIEVTSTGYDASTGSTNRVETSHTVTGIFDRFETDRLDDTLVETGDLKALIKPINGYKPSVGDVLVADSIEYTVMGVESVRAYDTDFLWELQVRK